MATSLRRRPPTNVLEREREEFLKALSLAVGKAINQQECAVKEKHLRTTILATHKEHGAGSFWDNALRLPLEGHPIVAWKFCHVLHKILREGDPHVMSDSMKYRTKIGDLGRLWGHLKDGYGRLILHYCKLLLTKLEFHKRNPAVPGNLVMSEKHLSSLGDKDVNNWFEVAIEMLDYQDELLAVQKHVFESLDMSRANSLTASGQCRLAPLILCVLDASCLYDHLVKMLFKLHSSLPPDTLVGHRDRFNAQFKQLKQFFYTSSNLQYFRNLCSIPPLPDSPPDFLVASNFDTYVPFRVLVHGQEPSEVGSETPPDARSEMGDTSDTIFPNGTFDSPPPPQPPAQNGGFNEKDQIINSLRHDLDDTKAALQRLHGEYQSSMDQYQNRILQLEHQETTNKEVIDQMSEENERYRLQAESWQNEKNLQTAVRLEESEKKAQSSEEKFKKMKEVYVKLREEHIQVLQKVGTLQKDIENSQKTKLDLEDQRRHAIQELETLKLNERISQEKLQESANVGEAASAQLNQLQLRIQQQEEELNASKLRFETESNQLNQKLLESSKTGEVLRSEIGRHTSEMASILDGLLATCMRILEESIEEFDNPAHLSVTSSPEFILTCTGPCIEALEGMKGLDCSSAPALASAATSAAHSLSKLILHGKATSNAAPVDRIQASSITGDTIKKSFKTCGITEYELVDVCRSCGRTGIEFFSALKTSKSWGPVEMKWSEAKSGVELLEEKFRSLLGRMGDVNADELGDQMEKEMKGMSRAIEEAATKFNDLLVKSRATDKGIRLEVNEKIIDACTGLMKAVMVLVEKARDLQAEIVASGKGTGSLQEFYKRHHKWTEGLLSAAKSIGIAARFLVDTADGVLTGKGKFEDLMVASQEIAACTAQLVVASRVKAEKGSERLSAVSKASKAVTEATAGVLGTVKSGKESLTEEESLDFSNLSLHNSKKMEMDSQVRVLELETLVEKERRKLGELRKRHYQLAEEASANREGTPQE